MTQGNLHAWLEDNFCVLVFSSV